MRDRKRTLVVVAGVAVIALGIGVLAGKYVTSPADAAADAKPPDAGPVTAPVESRTLESTVVTRSDAKFAGSVAVAPEVASLAVPAVVTGQVPKVGDNVKEAEPLLEIAGRPVLSLEGTLPMYRTLRPGTSGPDVKQLEETLQRLGYDPGNVDEDFTLSTSQAVADLYDDAGYEPPEADEEAQAAVEAAEENANATQSELDSAEQALEAASRGPSEVEKKQAEQAVDNAERALAEAKQTGDNAAIAAAEDELELAKLQLAELLEGTDTTAEQEQVDAARGRLPNAQTELDEARAAAGTPLPAAEVVYVSTLPRRVDSVEVKRGEVLNGTAMKVSGADMVLVGNVDDSDRESLKTDMPATIDLPDGDQVEGKITNIKKATGTDATGYDITIKPNKLKKSQVSDLRDANVRVTIPISSTGGDVLAVPTAAITTGSGGESRVEVADDDGDTRLVTVEVGLTAEGYAEVTPTEGDLAEGDLVVVGQ